MFNYVYIIFKHINQVLNFKELEAIIFYIKLFLVLKISCLYANLVTVLIYFMLFACAIKHNYIRLHGRNILDLLKEFKLITCNLLDEMIRD